MYNIIARIVTEVGPRAPCSEEERKAAELVKEELNNYCDETHLEDFTCYPKAFLGWIRIDVIMLVASVGIFLLTPFQSIVFPAISIAMGIFAVLCMYKQFLKYEEWTPKFLPYKLKNSQNVIGTFKPASGQVKKRVVFSGHLDSAFRFNLIHYTKAGYAFFFLGGVLVLFTILIVYAMQLILAVSMAPSVVFTVFVSLFSWITVSEPILMAVIILIGGKTKKLFYKAFRHINNTAEVLILSNIAWGILMLVLLWNFLFGAPATSLVSAVIYLFITNILSMVALMFFVSDKATPGVIDNLTAVGICMCIAKILGEWRQNYPDNYPQDTEVVIAIVGCEEVGLRGSQAFATRHAAEYNTIDTTCINFESISDAKRVTIFNDEKTTGTKLSPEVYNLLDQCAEELGIRHVLDHMPGTAGGTDAAGLVRGGLKASSLCGLKYKDYLAYYHTDRDNLDLLNKERRPWADHGKTWDTQNVLGAMEQSLCIGIRYLEKKDLE
jgi:hypothetical protein